VILVRRRFPTEESIPCRVSILLGMGAVRRRRDRSVAMARRAPAATLRKDHRQGGVAARAAEPRSDLRHQPACAERVLQHLRPIGRYRCARPCRTRLATAWSYSDDLKHWTFKIRPTSMSRRLADDFRRRRLHVRNRQERSKIAPRRLSRRDRQDRRQRRRRVDFTLNKPFAPFDRQTTLVRSSARPPT